MSQKNILIFKYKTPFYAVIYTTSNYFKMISIRNPKDMSEFIHLKNYHSLYFYENLNKKSTREKISTRFELGFTI